MLFNPTGALRQSRRRTRKLRLMKFRPLHDRVVVRRLEGEEKTKGGIIIPDTVKEKPQEGEIVAAGPGGRDESGKLTPLRRAINQTAGIVARFDFFLSAALDAPDPSAYLTAIVSTR